MKSKIFQVVLLLYVSIMLFFLGGMSPLGFFAIAPLIVIGYVFNIRVLLVSVIVGSILVGSLGSSQFVEGLFFAGLGVLAFLMLFLMRSNKSGWKVIGITTAVSLGIGLVIVGAAVQAKNINVFQELQTAISQITEKMIAFSKSRGAQEKDLLQLSEHGKSLQWVVQSLWPSLGIITFWSALYFTYVFAAFVLNRMGFPFDKKLQFTQGRCPEWLVWVLIIASALLVGKQTLSIAADSVHYLFLINIFVISSFIYFLQGLSITAFFLQATKVGPVMRSVFYALLLLQGTFWILLALIGVLDHWVNWRKFAKR